MRPCPGPEQIVACYPIKPSDPEQRWIWSTYSKQRFFLFFFLIFFFSAGKWGFHRKDQEVKKEL